MDVRKKLNVNNLVGTAWAWPPSWPESNEDSEFTGVSMGVYTQGEGRCQCALARLEADKDTGKVTLIVNQSVLAKFGIEFKTIDGEDDEDEDEDDA